MLYLAALFTEFNKWTEFCKWKQCMYHIVDQTTDHG